MIWNVEYETNNYSTYYLGEYVSHYQIIGTRYGLPGNGVLIALYAVTLMGKWWLTRTKNQMALLRKY